MKQGAQARQIVELLGLDGLERCQGKNVGVVEDRLEVLLHQAGHQLRTDDIVDLLELANVTFSLHQIQQDLHLLWKGYTWLLLQKRQQEVHGVLR